MSREIDNRRRWPQHFAAALVLALVVASPTAARAGPWTKDAGQFYVKLSEGFFISDSFVDGTGKVVSGTDYRGLTSALYAEVGVYRGLQLSAYVPYLLASNSERDGASFIQGGGADAIFGVQLTPPLPIPFPWALRVDVKVPLYDVGGVGGPLATRFPVAGDGQLDFTFWLSAGGSLPGMPLYFFGELGYRHRSEIYLGNGDSREFGDGLALFAQAGYTVGGRLLLAANVTGVFAAEDDAVTKSYLTVGPALSVSLWRLLALEATFDPIVYAKNSSSGIGFGLGLSYRN